MAAYPIVDIHTHMFNADDLPVRGFVKHVIGSEHGKAKKYAKFLDEQLQDRAPNFDEDLRRLQALLGRGLQDAEAAMIQTDHAEEKYLTDVAEMSAALTLAAQEDPELAEELAVLFPAGDARPEFGPGDVVRAIKFAAHFASSRVDLPRRYSKGQRRNVKLAIPMLVDLDSGVSDKPVSTIDQQIELFDLLSEASIRRLLPGAEDLLLLPFVAFDPVRQWSDTSAPTPLEQVQTAVLDHGFVGVKVYPPMGWAPRGNEKWHGENKGAELDAIVLEFATWCVENDVPVTAHGNDSQYADPDRFGGVGSPARWQELLRQEVVRNLRVNLGHFGGAHDDVSEYVWTEQIAQLMTTFENVYADVGCHDLSTEEVQENQFTTLATLAKQHPRVETRTMFGTDWYMQAIQEDYDDFLELYETGWREQPGLGEASLGAFMGGNALRFLGFDDPDNKNAARVIARFAEFRETPPAWLFKSTP